MNIYALSNIYYHLGVSSFWKVVCQDSDCFPSGSTRVGKKCSFTLCMWREHVLTCGLVDFYNGYKPLCVGEAGTYGRGNQLVYCCIGPFACAPHIADDCLLLKIERWYLNHLENIATESRPRVQSPVTSARGWLSSSLYSETILLEGWTEIMGNSRSCSFRITLGVWVGGRKLQSVSEHTGNVSLLGRFTVYIGCVYICVFQTI